MNFLWMRRDRKFFLTSARGKGATDPMCIRLRLALRLTEGGAGVEFVPLPNDSALFSNIIVTAAVHRFQESIGGRLYQIEVRAIAAERWRAYIVRLPGVPTALMPFYGRTPDEAARLLSDWLTKAHQRASQTGAA